MLDKIVLGIIKLGITVALSSTLVIALIWYKSYILLCLTRWYFPEYGQDLTVWQIFGFLSILGLVKSKLQDMEDKGDDDGLKKAVTIGKYVFYITLLWGISYAVRFWLM